MHRPREAEWYSRIGGSADPRLRLVCYPHAGGSGALFGTWPPRIDPRIELLVAQLPGRGARIGERPLDALRDLLAPLVDHLAPLCDRPVALFGHSMGAVLAFEIARRFSSRNFPAPIHVFVSASPAPDAERRMPPLHQLSDDMLLASLRTLAGPGVDMLDDRALAALVLPVVRADLHAVENHRLEPGAMLSCPLTVFAGADDAEVPSDRVLGWRRFSSGPSAVRVFPGGHFFPMTAADVVVRAINDLLAPAIAAEPADARRTLFHAL